MKFIDGKPFTHSKFLNAISIVGSNIGKSLKNTFLRMNTKKKFVEYENEQNAKNY